MKILLVDGAGNTSLVDVDSEVERALVPIPVPTAYGPVQPDMKVFIKTKQKTKLLGRRIYRQEGFPEVNLKEPRGPERDDIDDALENILSIEEYRWMSEHDKE